jgi:hypothetical protein
MSAYYDASAIRTMLGSLPCAPFAKWLVACPVDKTIFCQRNVKRVETCCLKIVLPGNIQKVSRDLFQQHLCASESWVTAACG